MKRLFFLLLLAGLVLGLLKVLFWWEVGPIPQGEARYLPSVAGERQVLLAAGPQYARGKTGSVLLGQHYRDLWTTPVQVPVLQMNQQGGGLTVEKLGGGQQTTSFTLSDEAGNTFALRSVDKDPLDVLPPFWQKTFAASFVRDQVSATHPYGALVVPVLAQALGIFHPTPRLVYVPPADPAFSAYPDLPGHKLYMLEEKFSSKAAITSEMGPATDLIDTDEMLGKRFRKNHHRIDEDLFARCRLLDLLIGDWDRHQGQWNWAVYQEAETTLYKPIPKDRDQAFSHFSDGVIPTLAATLPPLRKFTSFGPDFDEVQGLSVNAAFLDARALTSLTLENFLSTARDMQRALTDDVIQRAVRALPAAIHARSAADLEESLRRRRDGLQEAAREFYLILARHVTVVGSDQDEQFEVHRLNDQETRVQVFALQGKDKSVPLLYDRVFRHEETRKLTLHGLDGEDVFLLRGKVRNGIRVEVYGGRGEDEITDRSEVKGWRKRTIVYDTSGGTSITRGPTTRDRTTADVAVHAYDREGQ